MVCYEHSHLWIRFNDDAGGSISGAGVDYFGGAHGWRQELLAWEHAFDWQWWQDINTLIGRLSQEGWELVSVVGMRAATDFWFKRPTG